MGSRGTSSCPLKAPQGWETSKVVLLLPPSYGRNKPLPKCHPSLLCPCQDGGMAAKEGGGEQGAGVWWIYFHPCPRCGAEPWTPPGVMQLLGIKTLTSETLISNGKEFQGCCGRILCHRLPLPRTGIHVGKSEVSLCHSSLQKQPMVCADGPQHVWGTQESVFLFPSF